MIFILDTDHITFAELPDSPEYLRLRARVAQLSGGDEVVTTIITYEEQTRGWLDYAAKSRAIAHQIKAYGRLKRHLCAYLEIDVLEFDAPAAREYERLLCLKLRMGAFDLKIAAITLAQNAVLLSRNVQDFGKVPGLRLEDWTRE